MKKLLLLSFIILELIACSSTNTTTPFKLSQNIYHIAPDTVISVASLDSYRIPEGSQIIHKTGLFKTIDNVYDEDGNEILIPRNAIIVGVYKNDGLTCNVSWQTIYKNMDDYYNDQGSFSLAKRTYTSKCTAAKGIKTGNRLTIRFKPLVGQGY